MQQLFITSFNYYSMFFFFGSTALKIKTWHVIDRHSADKDKYKGKFPVHIFQGGGGGFHHLLIFVQVFHTKNPTNRISPSQKKKSIRHRGEPCYIDSIAHTTACQLISGPIPTMFVLIIYVLFHEHLKLTTLGKPT